MLGFKKDGKFRPTGKSSYVAPTGRSPFGSLEAELDNKKGSNQPKMTPARFVNFAKGKKDEFITRRDRNAEIDRIKKNKSLTGEQMNEAIKQARNRFRSEGGKVEDLQKSEKLTNLNLERQREGEKAKKDEMALLDLQKEMLKIDDLNIDQTSEEYDKVVKDILGQSKMSGAMGGGEDNALRDRYMEAYREDLTSDEEKNLKKKYPELDFYELKRKKLEQIIKSGATDEITDLKTGKKTTTMNKTRLELLSNRLDQLRGTGKVLRQGVARAGAKSALGQTITSDGMMSDSSIRSFAQRIGDNVKMSDKDFSRIPNFAVAVQSMTPEQKNYLLTITDKKQLKKEFERLDKIKNTKSRELEKQRNYLGKKLLELQQKGNMPNASPEDLEKLTKAIRIIDDIDQVLELRGYEMSVAKMAVEGLPDDLSSVREYRERARQSRDEYDERQKQRGNSNVNIDAQKRREQLLSMGIMS
tara:strand:+ start:15186 stop:16598 length:1413 start_codon:yes stop_codon:yes gene_type:complete